MLKINFPLEKRFSNGTQINFNLLRGINLVFKEGFLYSIKGENGSGKTTFLNIISHLSSFEKVYGLSHNELQINFQYDQKDKEKIRKEMLSFVFQDPHIINTYTINENLRIANPDFDIRQESDKLINGLSFSHDAERSYLSDKINYLCCHYEDSPYYLSGGEKQLLAFIRAMIKPSTFIFADEPWANMDINLKDFVERQLFFYTRNRDIFACYRNNDQNKNIVIIITHANHNEINKTISTHDKNWSCNLSVRMNNSESNFFKKTELKLDRYFLNDIDFERRL